MKLLAIFGLASIAALTAQTTAPPKPRPAKAAAAVAPAVPLEAGLYTTITTSMGPIILKLYEKESPITVKNFMDLAQGKKEWTDPKTRQRVKRPLYNGLTFHRVIPGFMIQGGDPQGTGMGGTDEIPDEFAPSLTFDRAGRLAMANAGPRTGSSQFFITEGPTTHLNGRHTIFGQVVQGQAVVSKIANTPKGEDDKPRTPVRMLRVTFQRVGPGAQPGPAASKPKPAVAKPKPSVAKPKPSAVKPAPAKAKPQSSGTSK
ncbi:MAG: peptidylprolyl isomerase [Bryobacteraceae bacterium]|nr:peptidylprolyl isomerase [Bryobacteraceae bacterium]